MGELTLGASDRCTVFGIVDPISGLVTSRVEVAEVTGRGTWSA